MVSKVFGCEEFISEVSLLIQGHCQGQKQISRLFSQNTSWSGFLDTRNPYLMLVCYVKVIVKVKRGLQGHLAKMFLFCKNSSPSIYVVYALKK